MQRSLKRYGVKSVSILSRLGVMLLVFISVILIILSYNEHVLITKSRMSISENAIPVISLMSAPADSLNSFYEAVSGWINTRKQNITLRSQNDKLLKWQSMAIKLENENKQLRELLDINDVPDNSAIPARILGSINSHFSHNFIINKGSERNIKINQAVTSLKGLVGRISETNSQSSKVIALTDNLFRVPIEIEGSNAKAMAAGNGSPVLDLIHVSDLKSVKPGARITTSDDGNLIPAGIIVGEIISIDNDNIKAQPYADWRQLKYVSIIKKPDINSKAFE